MGVLEKPFTGVMKPGWHRNVSGGRVTWGRDVRIGGSVLRIIIQRDETVVLRSRMRGGILVSSRTIEALSPLWVCSIYKQRDYWWTWSLLSRDSAKTIAEAKRKAMSHVNGWAYATYGFRIGK